MKFYFTQYSTGNGWSNKSKGGKAQHLTIRKQKLKTPDEIRSDYLKLVDIIELIKRQFKAAESGDFSGLTAWDLTAYNRNPENYLSVKKTSLSHRETALGHYVSLKQRVCSLTIDPNTLESSIEVIEEVDYYKEIHTT